MKAIIRSLLAICGLAGLGNIASAQVPNISYPGAPSITVGVGNPVSLTPTNSGGVVTGGTGGYSTVSFLATVAATTKPIGITTDASGNSYIIATKNGNPVTKIYRVTATGVVSTVTLPTNPLSNPTGIGIDGNGFLFVADQNNGNVYKFTLNVGTNTATLTSTIGTNRIGNIYSPSGIDFDAANNIYVADQQNNGATNGIIFKINASTLAVSQYLTGLNNPDGLAFDPVSGSIYYSSPNLTTVINKVTSVGAKSTIPGFNTPHYLAADDLGDVYVADGGSNTIKEISAAGVVSSMITTGLSTPYQVSFDNSKNLYEADNATFNINKSTQTTFYTIAGTLPAGLSFNTSTGVISGTPTAVTGAISVTVTGYNSSGNSSVTISITCVRPPALNFSPTAYTFVNGTSITPFSVNNTGGGIIGNYSISSGTLPAGLTFTASTGTISGTPTAVTSGSVAITVTGSNGGGSSSATVNITVNNPPPPIITYTDNDVYTNGVAISPNLTPNASGGGPVVSYAAPSLPSGLSINTSTGVISGTPNAVVSPAQGYVVTATNQGGSGTFTIHITVNNPPVPNFTYTNPAAVTYGGGPVSVTPSNSGGAATSCTISPTGTGIVVSSTGVVSGTPNAAGTTTYTITPSNAGGAGPNATVTITVNPAVLTVTANNQTKIYGAANPTLTFNYSGFVNGDTQASLTTGATVTTTAITSSPVSPPTYPITASGVVDPNYTFNYVAGALTINAAPLNIKANAQTKVYGTAFTFAGTEFTTTGLQPGDAVTSVTLTSPGAAATATVAGSTYTITASAAVGTGLSNYTITYTTNTFTVTRAPLTVTANNQTKVYGSTFTFAGTEFTVGAGQLKNSDNVSSANITSTGSAATATVPGSPYPIIINTAAGTGLANYTIGYVNGSMTVTPAALTITANNQTRDVGILTALTVSYTGFQNGETSANLTTQPTVTTTATVTSPPSPPTYPITASGAADPNYTISYVAGTLTITSPGTHAYTYDWTGASNTAWENPLNWDINGVQQTVAYPGYSSTTNAIADVGVNIFYTASKSPVIISTINVNSVTYGSDNATQIGLTVNGTLTTSTGITLQADNNIFGNSLTINLSGTGTINVPNLNVVNNQTALSFETTSINSSVAALNVAGNITLTTTAGFLSNIGSTFTLTGGTTTVGGTLVTNNNPGFLAATTSTFSIIPATTATLNLTNANAINLDNNTSVIDFDHTGSIVNYTGTASPQTVYTNSTANASTGVKYQNLTISTTGSGVPAAGTLTVDKNMITSGPTNFGTNAPTVTVAGTWTNTANVTQGAAIIAVNTQLIATSNTITGGTGTLTAASMEFNGGTLVAGAGTVTSQGTYQNDGGTFNCGTAANANVIFNGTYKNNSGIFIANPTSTSKVTFTGTNQTLVDNTTVGTTFNNVNFNGNNTAITGSTGNFAVGAAGTLTMAANAKLTAGSGAVNVGYLTLMSNSSSTASVAAIPATSSVVGAVNVQRFITGGTGTRGYRLITSPVNISTNAAGSGNLSLAYLSTNGSFGGTTYNGAFTEGPGTGFTYNGSFNPIIYLYDESRPSTNQGFTAGKNIGIYSINVNNTVNTLTSGIVSAGQFGIPVGNSYLLYYVGDNHLTDQTAVLSARVPESISITATGYLNQSNVPVKFWNTNSTNIPYNVTTGTSYPGLNQVGNPYPSTISLDVVATENAAVNKVFWELVPGGSYVSYNASSHAVSDARASKYIVSGQGFLVEAQATGETLTFKETEKVAYPTGLASPYNTATGTALLMDIPSKPGLNNSDVVASADDKTFQALLPQSSALTGLHLQLTKNTYNLVQTGIYFGTGGSDKFVQNEDAVSVNGSGAQVFLSSYSSDNVNVGINQLGDYSGGKRIKLYAGVTSTGPYTISLADIANIDTVNYNVFLVDKKMNDSLDMVRYKSYAFSINNSDTSTYGANRFVLAIEHVAVPQYKLISLVANKVPGGVKLTWKTVNASNYTGYILQKQDSNGNYNPIYSDQSDIGESKYSYVDQNPVIGNNTYRLSQNDVNGKVTYSDPVTIKYNKAASISGLTLYPNPSNSIINVIYTDKTSDNSSANYTVDIFNAAGTFIKHESVSANSWTENISAYKLGVYVLQLKDNSGNLVGQIKFIKNL